VIVHCLRDTLLVQRASMVVLDSWMDCFDCGKKKHAHIPPLAM
jgi:hypothetical protein